MSSFSTLQEVSDQEAVLFRLQNHAANIRLFVYQICLCVCVNRTMRERKIAYDNPYDRKDQASRFRNPISLKFTKCLYFTAKSYCVVKCHKVCLAFYNKLWGIKWM
mgnify:CR=1 FL=1